MNLFQGKLSAKISHHTATSVNAANINSATGGTLTDGLLEFERSLYSLNRSFPINPAFDPALGRVTTDFQNIVDNVSSGYEAELVYNPIGNWRILLNAGLSNVEIDTPITFGFIDERRPFYENFGGGWSRASYDGTRTVQQAYEELIGSRQGEIESNLGPIGGNTQSWRVNLVTNYQFTTPRLKGFSVGANARYRGPRSVGFGEKRAEVSPGVFRTVTDKDVEYKSDSYVLCGATAGYRFKAFKAAWRAQLNVNNLFNTARVYLTRTYADGSPRNYGRQPGREFVLSLDATF